MINTQLLERGIHVRLKACRDELHALSVDSNIRRAQLLGQIEGYNQVLKLMERILAEK